MGFEIRQERQSAGRRLRLERAEYFRLMDLGYANAEACERVGINPRTGREWRNGRPDGRKRPPVAPVRREQEPPGASRHLSEIERVHIADRIREMASIRVIAAELGRSPSTISREVRRNRSPLRGSSYVYRPYAAQRRAEARRPRPKPRKLETNPELRHFVRSHLGVWWSPEQISKTLARRFSHRPEMRVCHETIYQAIYHGTDTDLTRTAALALRRRRTYRRPQRQATSRRPRFTGTMLMIRDRPHEAEDRTIPGHWEGDLIIGAKNASAIGTLVERASRFTMLVHLPGTRRTDLFHRELAGAVQALPPILRRSLTWDQGNEMATHQLFTTASGMPVYFCDPASPWQRGTNENTNGLLRQYFPKGTDLRRFTSADLIAVAAELNTRPRKTLGWQTPAQRLRELITSPM